MTDAAQVSPDPISAGESERDLSPPPVERKRKKCQKASGDRNLPLDAKATDSLVRLILALPPTPHPKRTPVAEPSEISKETTRNTPSLDDLVHVHVLGSVTFGNSDPEDARAILQQIYSHRALQPLDKTAKIIASTYIFQARSAYRLRTVGKYWVLGGIGAAYPYPLAIRTSAFPCWKREIRSLESLLKRLRKSAGHALRLEADAILSNRPEQMPAELILSAEIALHKAVNWMQAFPSPVDLRSKYRKMMRPDMNTESVGVVAYVLDRLYREQTSDSSLKVKEIERLIAELETAFLGQSIHYGPDFGCPAVRLQIGAVKRSKVRTAVDSQVTKQLQTTNKFMETARKREPSRLTAAFDRLWQRLDRHQKAFDAWHERTEARFKQDLRRALEATTYADEGFEATDEYIQHMEDHFDLRKRWIDEHRGHLNALESPDLELLEYLKVMRAWMRRWESLWDFPM